jgi:trimeric autotransporter adhesin
MLIGVLLAACTASAVAQVTTTQVTDTVYHADGTTATGTVLISWQAFTTSSGQAVPSGNTSATIASGGALSVALAPNSGANPVGTYYTVVYHLDDGSVSRQYWVVPVSATAVRISTIESTVLPTSVAMQTVSKSYVDTAIVAAFDGHLPSLAPYVQTSPLESQVISQPSGTQLDVNSLNGVEYASQYVTGSGNNGIANAITGPACASGCEIVAEPGYSSESYLAAAFNSRTHLHDTRGGREADSYKNPLDVVTHGASAAQSIDDVSTQSAVSIFAQIANAAPAATSLSISQEGLAGGSNLFPQQIDGTVPYSKMGYNALTLKGTYNTQGQHILSPQSINCYGVGDCLMGSRSIVASGGLRDSGDEGAHPFDLQTHEDSKVFLGTCTSGCATGSTSVMITPTAAAGTQGDGRFLIDTNAAKTITSTGTGGALVSGNATGPHASAQFSGTSFPVSTFLSLGQAVPSQSNNIAPGTVTFSIATSGVPSGYATNTAAIGAPSGVACVVDQTAGSSPNNYEMAPYAVVDGTHLQMSFNKPHALLASLAFGGLCGYGLEQTVDTAGGIRQLFPVLGSTSATTLYYAGGSTPIVGVMNQTSGFLNVSATIASATRASGTVTVTTSANLPANINGLSVTIAGAADSSYNGTYPVTTTGTNSFTYAQSGASSSTSGGTVSILTGGFALYPMAEVLSVYDASASSVDGLMTLAANNVPWAASDPVEEPHFYQEYVTADTEALGQSVPRPTLTTRAGLQYQQNNGPGLIGWSIANAAPTTNYLGYGGTHTAPDDAYEATGVWRRTMNLGAGEEAVFAIHCNLHGCGSWNSSYNLFELDSSAGIDTVQYSPATSTLTLNLRGTTYSFSPTALTAGTINVGTLNATTINGGSIGGGGGGGVQIAGDIGGTDAAPVVTGIQGKPVSATAPTAGQALIYNGTTYVPKAPSTTVTLEHVFSGAGTFNYTHNLGSSYPLMTCYVNSGSSAFTANNVDANNIAITVTASSDITCTFGI